MTRFYLTVVCTFALFMAVAQGPGKKLQETAKTMMKQGDLENAIALLESAVKQAPSDLEIQKDLAYACYLYRDFAKSIQVGTAISERNDADEQVFQILGLSYKAIASYKDGAKMYKNAIRKFPNSSVLLNEYGELLAMDKNLSEAIQQWEKGIAADPNYSGNYYNACIYYTKSSNWARVIVYGELFVNMESFTDRTQEVKKALVNAWQKILVPTVATQQLRNSNNGFEKALLTILAGLAETTKAGFQVSNSTSIRTQFLKEWSNGPATTYPYHLFRVQQYFVDEGMMEAYDQWLFGEAVDPNAYKTWQTANSKESMAFSEYQRSRVFKMPAGQNYFNR